MFENDTLKEIIKILNTIKLKDDITIEEIITDPEKFNLIVMYIRGQPQLERKSGISIKELSLFADKLVRVAKRKGKTTSDFRGAYLKYQFGVIKLLTHSDLITEEQRTFLIKKLSDLKNKYFL